ncbi:probable disease resistance RPP8-like protein 2 [Camellia sinensis]|uniref:probable disease resistance RPP8-like protein 2 n=1 Tax=Camellia sinensis TaxID=4442 RepID=UPI001035FE3A|nr:probable disease resistance RPP8-like protein 2 [Camellia sinensis]
MAEGFISQEERREEETLMDVAEHFLGELAQRCMVQVELKPEEYSTDRGSRSKEKNFLQIIDYRHTNEQVHLSSSSMETLVGTSSGSKIHRLAIYEDKDSSYLHLLNQEERDRHLLSVSFFNTGRVGYGGRWWISAKRNRKTNAFEVLGVGNTKFTKLSSTIGNLKYLETVDLRTNSEISVPNVLWKIEGLIYLYLPFDYFIVTEGKLQVDGSRKLEILKNLATDKVDAKGLTTLTNLRRLDVRIQENLEDLELVNNYLVSNHRLQYTTTLVVNCDFSLGEGLSLQIQLLKCNCLVELYINGITGKLPEYDHHFCRSLAHLTLFGSHLKDDLMVTLEKLPNLKVLYLINAFVGKEIVCSAHGFPLLTDLCHSYLQMETWRVDGGAMPVLYSLFITSCENLKMLLDGLRFISTLHELNICDMSAAFNDRLSEGGEDFHKFRHIPHICFEYISPFVEEFQEVPTSILEPDKLSAHGSPQKLNKHSYGSTNASSVEHFLKKSTAVS